MDEYIIKEIAIGRIKRVKPHVVMSEYGVGYERGLKDAIGILNATPAADAQPVKHGRWIDCSYYDSFVRSEEQDIQFKCSNCGHRIYNKPNDDNLFCGHCSARMDLKSGEESDKEGE